MITAFCIVATLAFTYLCFLWSTASHLNTIVKVCWAVMAMYGFACVLSQLGFHK